MFKRIEFTIALKFTACLALILLANGIVFLTIDYRISTQNIDMQLRLQSSLATATLSNISLSDKEAVKNAVPPPLLPRIRVLDTSGNVVYSGELLQEYVTNELGEGLTDVSLGGEDYRLITASIASVDHERIGFLQMAGNQRISLSELPGRIARYLLISLIASGFIWLIAWYFARGSIKPAREAMARLEQFTQDASHELRTPLATIRSSLELAQKNKRYAPAVDAAVRNIDHINELVTHLLTLARLDAYRLKKTSCDLVPLVGNLVAEHMAFAKENGVTLEAQLPDRVTISCDPVLVRQLFGNLLTNAIKFNHRKGKVFIRLDDVSCEIADTGMGMDDDVQKHIFDRFYQADTARSGLGYGLGLSLAKKIADVHQWQISVHSVKGDGSTFRVDF